MKVGLATPLVAAALWLGCAAGPAPQDHFYRIQLPPPSRTGEAPLLEGALEVQRLRADALTDERAVLYRGEGSAELLQSSYHFWVDPPTAMLQNGIVRWLRDANVAERVVTPALRVDASHRLAGRLLRLERVVGGGDARIELELELALRGGSSRAILLLESYREERTVESNSVGAAADAFGDALGAVLESFVADLERLESR